MASLMGIEPTITRLRIWALGHIALNDRSADKVVSRVVILANVDPAGIRHFLKMARGTRLELASA